MTQENGDVKLEKAADQEKIKPETPDGNDDEVLLDECDEGEKTSESAAKPDTVESEKSAGKAQPARKKKERLFRRKVIRVPKEVFDYMTRTEEDGTVRINVTQFSLFFTNEILKKFVPVQADVWDTIDTVPLMDVSVPPTAKENPSLIVDNFSNEPAERAAQEKRLQTMIENRKKFAEQQKQREANGDKSTNKKRSAELSAPSSAPESGSAAKQPRLDEKNSAQAKVGKTSPKKTGAQTGQKASAKGTSSKSASKGGSIRNLMSKKLSPPPPYRGSGGSPFIAPQMGHREWVGGPPPFQGYPRDNVYGEQMRYGEPYPFNDRRAGGEVSPWARPPAQANEMYQLESVMRRAAQENASSFEAVRQVEKMGLGSVVGAILNAVDPRKPGYPPNDGPSRGIPSLLDDSYKRDPRMAGGFDYNSGAMRDISRYVEPLDGFNDRTRSSQPRVDRITYPTMGRGGAVGPGASGAAPLFGQSYPAFANQPFGGSMDYQGGRGRSPMRRSYR
ncbi:hypothetical protein GCK32_006915 [Trichostrongylus colubriformis]|uniref:Uncharacterized protein n=1 Tax=Trichostrongylus colubriformis TaxID=6319 RepID=A0AAN8J1L1_TRICO